MDSLVANLSPLAIRNRLNQPMNEYSQHSEAREESAWVFLRALEENGIKLSINAAHLLYYSRIDKVQVFDTMQIHIGRHPGLSHFTENDDCDDLTFTIFQQPAGPRATIGGFNIGRLGYNAALASETSLNVARRWLNVCQNDHGECFKSVVSRLPTRVLDVRSNSNNGIRLVDSKGESGSYVTLSHCWGGDKSLVLLRDNVEAFQTEIRPGNLPAIFRDAITITRALNNPYLWIDGLCIVQDSKEDWENESKQMGSYYGNAVLTLCASAAERSSTGIFCPRIQSQPRKLIPVSLNLFTGLDLKGQVYLEMNNRISDTFETLQSLEDRSFILSGMDIAGTTQSEESISLKASHRLIRAYSRRKLSVASDKLPALAGLVRRIHPSIGGEYLAGLWSCDIHRGLNWDVAFYPCVGQQATAYRAPSWSWAATDSPITSNDVQFISVKGGFIYVRGFVKPLFRSTQIMGSKGQKRPWGLAFYDNIPDQKNISKVRHELRILHATINKKDCLLLFWHDKYGLGDLDFDLDTLLPDDCIVLMIGFSERSRTARGIILRQEKCRDDFIFKRMGICQLPNMAMDWMKTWEDRKLMLV
ncbi:heterokaryon incompatibility protein-domain-containing protein [Xylariaceae sp. FL1272]|nr:heterokaryon incompatibility protein-domain-containing protein [Xylariaceae sp. FL1272]